MYYYHDTRVISVGLSLDLLCDNNHHHHQYPPTCMHERDFLAWAWRILFLISIAMAGVGLYIRMRLEETPVFREIVANNTIAHHIPLEDFGAASKWVTFQ
jgi:MFS family permease